jgi:Tfp pilus assembly protein PilP
MSNQGAGGAVSAKAKTDVKAKTASSEVGRPAYRYSSVGKRDPFQPYLALPTIKESKIERKRQSTEEFSTDQYRLTGLITSTSQPRVLLEDPSGVGHTVRLGSRVGKNDGKIVQINAKGFVLMEEYTEQATGKKIKVPINVEMSRDEDD